MKLMQQVQQTLRVKHYALSTEQCYCQQFPLLQLRFSWQGIYS